MLFLGQNWSINFGTMPTINEKKQNTMNEFELIKTYFHQFREHESVLVGNGDDCAILQLPKDYGIAMSMDTLVHGVHFDDHFSAEDVGYKALAVNLSDLAAMGAIPAWVMLSLTLPTLDEKFLQGFQKGFFTHFKKYPMALIGGDITKGPLSITIQISGFMPKNKGVLRSGAQPGDKIYVTNTIGDAVLALLYLQNKVTLTAKESAMVLPKLYRPTPRIDEGMKLLDTASSMIDISDGLYGDLTHILSASHVGANLFIDELPLSCVLTGQPESIKRSAALHCGDSYELCFTVPKNKKIPALDSMVTCIGEITTGSHITLYDKHGCQQIVSNESYRHF